MRRDSSKMNDKNRKQSNNAKMWKTIKNCLVHVGLAIMSIIWLFPIFWVVMQSLRVEHDGEFSYTSYFFPKEYGLDNYVKLFTETGIFDFRRMFFNTLFVAVCSCLISTFFTISVAYCMSRLRFKMRKPFMNLTMI